MRFVANLQYDRLRGGAERLRHRVRAARRQGVRPRRHAARRPADHRHHQAAPPAQGRGVRLRHQPGRHPGLEDRGRVLASYTADGTRRRGGRAVAVRPRPRARRRRRRHGHRRPDLARARPRSVSFLPVPRGSHNMTLHPSGDYLYNSNSDLVRRRRTPTSPSTTSASRRTPSWCRTTRSRSPRPRSARSRTTSRSTRPAPAPTSRRCRRPWSSTPPTRANPEQISQIVDPAINVVHQSDPFRVKRPDGTWRRLLVITDERAGAAASVGVPRRRPARLRHHRRQGAGARRRSAPGSSRPPSRRTARPAPPTCCGIYPRQQMMTIAWYSQGVRVLDISGLATYEGSPDRHRPSATASG